MKTFGLLIAAAVVATAHVASAEDITIRMHAIDAKGVGKEIGTLRAVDTRKGLMLVPRLAGLAPGMHGFHVHANAACGAKGANGAMGAGLAAGSAVTAVTAKPPQTCSGLACREWYLAAGNSAGSPASRSPPDFASVRGSRP